MLAKGFAPSLSGNSVPALVLHYIKANKTAFGKSPYVRETEYSKFLVLEDDVRDLHVSFLEYAYTTVYALKGWVKWKKLKYVPVNVFCGDFAMSKFLKIHNSETISIPIQEDKEELLHSELTVARYYIVRNLDHVGSISFKEAVDELGAVLSKDWLVSYAARDPSRPYKEAVNILKCEFGIRSAKTYNDIINQLL